MPTPGKPRHKMQLIEINTKYLNKQLRYNTNIEFPIHIKSTVLHIYKIYIKAYRNVF